jgi:hypothetical protein
MRIVIRGKIVRLQRVRRAKALKANVKIWCCYWHIAHGGSNFD